MKNYILILSLMFLALGCNEETKVTKVTAMETFGLLSNDFAVLVDVREKSEVQNGMAKLAIWMPMSKIQSETAEYKDFLKSLPKDKQVVLYCGGGVRAQSAAEKLAKLGYKTSNMGGFKDWVAAKLPVKQ